MCECGVKVELLKSHKWKAHLRIHKCSVHSWFSKIWHRNQKSYYTCEIKRQVDFSKHPLAHRCLHMYICRWCLTFLSRPLTYYLQRLLWHVRAVSFPVLYLYSRPNLVTHPHSATLRPQFDLHCETLIHNTELLSAFALLFVSIILQLFLT